MHHDNSFQLDPTIDGARIRYGTGTGEFQDPIPVFLFFGMPPTDVAAGDGSGGRFGNFSLRWGAEAKISGDVSFVAGKCGSDKKVTLLLSGEDARAITFTGSGTYTFEHLRVRGNYSVRGVSEISASCLPLFLERALNFLPLAGDALDADFIDDELRGGGSTSNITGNITNAAGVGIDNVAVALSGTASRTVYTDGAGLYHLPALAVGTYQVTPSKAGVVFSPTSREFTFDSGQSLNGADFTAQDSFNIGGQTRNQNGAALSGVTITLNDGTQSMSVETNADGFYSFDAVAGGSFTLTATKAGATFNPASQTIAALSGNQKNVDFTAMETPAQLLELLLEEAAPSPTQVAVLDAMLFVRDPFAVLNRNNVFNLGTDLNTRVLVFVRNLQLQAGENAAVVGVNLVDSAGRTYDLVAENVRDLPDFDFKQVSFRLPDDLAPGACTVQIRAHGQISNIGVFRIKP